MELIIKSNEQIVPIEWNYEEVKQWALDVTSQYKEMIVTEDTIGIAKTKRADINKLGKMLDDARKSKKKDFMKPFTQFETEIKDVISVVNEASAAIDTQLKAFEEQRKLDKQKEIEQLFDGYVVPADWFTLDKIQKSQWLNATYSINKVKSDIEDAINKVDADLTVIRGLSEYAFEVEDKYSKCLDLTIAMQESNRLIELANRKKELELARAQAELERQESAQAIKKEAEDVKTTVESEVQTHSQGEWIRFKAFLTKEQAIALKDFFNASSIEYHPI